MAWRPPFRDYRIEGAAWGYSVEAETHAVRLMLSGVLDRLLFVAAWAVALSGVRWLGAVAPFGGVALLAGWGCVVLAARR